MPFVPKYVHFLAKHVVRLFLRYALIGPIYKLRIYIYYMYICLRLERQTDRKGIKMIKEKDNYSPLDSQTCNQENKKKNIELPYFLSLGIRGNNLILGNEQISRIYLHFLLLLLSGLGKVTFRWENQQDTLKNIIQYFLNNDNYLKALE